MGYPDEAAELTMLRTRELSSPLDSLAPVVSLEQFTQMIALVRGIFVSEAVEKYAVTITQRTRRDRALRLGASPRATLHLVRAAKARAVLEGREFVLPDDIDALAVPVLGHRMIAVARMAASAPDSASTNISDIIQRIVAETPVPLGADTR